jgi:hypothetical protein
MDWPQDEPFWREEHHHHEDSRRQCRGAAQGLGAPIYQR